MQEILNWTINTIRKENIVDSSWLEEQKFEWTPLVVKSLKSLLDENCTVLILTDDNRDWFGEYVLSNINDIKNEIYSYIKYEDFEFTPNPRIIIPDENIITIPVPVPK